MSFLEHDYKKAKTAPKVILPLNKELKNTIRRTVKKITDIVSVTLGPGGRPVICERPEPGLPAIVTKDGVTVIRHLAYTDPVEQVVLESFRDSAIRTVENAGDGTTTATILANAILKNMEKYLSANPKISPQIALRTINKYFENECLTYIQNSSLKVKAENSSDLLFKVAKLSTNGDQDLAKVVIDSFNLVGDSGHITISEEPGPSSLTVSKTDGYPFDKGFEQSLGIFSNEFINDLNNNRVYLENPHIVLINGKVLDLPSIYPLLQEIENGYHKKEISPNVIIMAHGFSKTVISQFAQFFKLEGALRVLPCITPIDMLPDSQYEFLMDIAAFTGGVIFNSVTNPVHLGKVADLGQEAVAFEMNRHRSIIHGLGKEETIIKRARVLKSQMVGATKLAKNILEERVGRLTGGIAKILIRGVSDASNREIKDRAEDAICAIRGALKHGVLPGGGKILLNLSMMADDSDIAIIKEVLGPSLREPILKLLSNCGMNDLEIEEVVLALVQNKNDVYDAMQGRYGNPIELGILDSSPAVSESLRSAVGIATLLATLGGVVVFDRDDAYDNSLSLQHNATQNDLDAASYEGNDTGTHIEV